MALAMPAIKCEITVTHREQGLINGAGFIGVILSSHIWGFMADTWGRHKVLRLALLLTFVFSAMSSVANSVLMLLLTRLCVGLSLVY